jgi:hypothetical protein
MDEIDDLEMAQYLSEKYDLPELPGKVKKQLSVRDQLKVIQDEKGSVNSLSIVPKRHRRT